MQKKTIIWIEQASTYLPLIGTAIVLILSTFAEGLLKSIPIAILLAIMATSFILTAVHLETSLQSMRKQVAEMENEVTELKVTQKNHLNALVPETRVMSLAEGFRVGIDRTDRIGHLRIYAISSQQILSFIKFHSFQIERCSVLLRGFSEDDAEHADFAAQIRLVVRDWYNMQRDGRIKNLRVKAYDFFPTEYECIFDSTIMMLGLYDSDPRDYSEVKVRGITLFDGSTQPGQNVIREYIERFDNLFETCERHHGSNVYDNLAPDSASLPAAPSEGTV